MRLKALPYSSAQLPVVGASLPQACEGQAANALAVVAADVIDAVSLDRVRDPVLVRLGPDSVELRADKVENDPSPELDDVSRERRDLEL